MVVSLYEGKGNLNIPGNYRGISLLSILGKIYTGIMAERLQGWVEKEHKISELQSGFRKGRRTIDNILVIQTIIST